MKKGELQNCVRVTFDILDEKMIGEKGGHVEQEAKGAVIFLNTEDGTEAHAGGLVSLTEISELLMKMIPIEKRAAFMKRMMGLALFTDMDKTVKTHIMEVEK